MKRSLFTVGMEWTDRHQGVVVACLLVVLFVGLTLINMMERA